MTPTYPNLFDHAEADVAIRRIEALTPDSTPLWGKMSVAQMLAHCIVAYDMVYTGQFPRPNPLLRWVLRTMVKDKVVGLAPYPRNTPTAPAFRIKDERDFSKERARLIAYVRRVASDGASALEGRESPSFGPLTAAEWNVLFSKHLDHHLSQFGV